MEGLNKFREAFEAFKEFVASIRDNWESLAQPLAKSIGRDEAFVDALLEQVENIFITSKK